MDNKLVQFLNKCSYNDLVEFYNAINVKVSFTCQVGDKLLNFKFKDDTFTIIDGEEVIRTISYFSLNEMVVKILNQDQEFLPLGSVVSLKVRDEELGNIMVMITQKMITFQEQMVYYDYAGIIYPFSNLIIDKLFYFSKALVKEVLFEGPRLEGMEENKFDQLKFEIIANEGYVNIAFVDNELKSKVNGRINGYN